MPSRASHLLPRVREHVLAAKQYFARRRLDQPKHAAAGGRLSAARFADETERFSFVDGEAHVVHRANDAGSGEKAFVPRELLYQVPHLHQRPALSDVEGHHATCLGSYR
jgi:hypothetical protein